MKIRLAFLVIGLFWSTFLVGVAVISLPYNPISIRYAWQTNIKGFIPEGWGFFTRNPREEDLYLYKKVDGGWEGTGYLPIARAANLLGARRTPRAQSIEMALLLKSVKQDQWVACEQHFQQCLADSLIVQVENTSPRPVMCGTYCIVRKAPIPWAWSSSGDVEMPSFITYLHVTCSE